MAIEPLDIGSLIVTLRQQKVILDSDLARIYSVPTFRFNEAVKRNLQRFPPDFRFQLTAQEWSCVQSLRSQIAILNEAPDETQPKRRRGQHRKYLPWAFTEHGALMAANVLNSERAVAMSPRTVWREIQALKAMKQEL